MSSPEISGGCQLNRPLIRIVVPFACNESEKGPEYETAMRDSLLQQFGRGEIFDIDLVFVLQEKDGKIHQLQDWSAFDVKTLIFKADGYDYPTTFHQAGDGFRQCLDSDYCLYMTANDVLAPMFLASALQRARELSAKVVYGDTLFMDSDMNPHRCSKPPVEFRPFQWYEKRVKKIPNLIPDICLIDCSILEKVPFDPKYKRAAFMIWWYRIWEEFGHLAFAYVNAIGCLYRPHEEHASNIETWVSEGYEIASRWLQGRPWRKYTGSAEA